MLEVMLQSWPASWSRFLIIWTIIWSGRFSKSFNNSFGVSIWSPWNLFTIEMHITEPFTPALLQNERNKFASISMLRMPCWNYCYPSENGCWSRWGQCGRCSHNSWHFWLWTMVHGLWSTFTWTSLRSKDFGQVKHLKEVFTCRHMLHMICIPLSFNPLTFFQIFMTTCLIEVLVQFQIVQICTFGPILF